MQATTTVTAGSSPTWSPQAIHSVPVLDHGFVALLNISGPTRRAGGLFDADDTDPSNCARMSFDQMNSGRTRAQDLKLADYLMRNRHTTPFEMITVWLEMKLPIFVARQFVRHRTVSINEVSGRYVQLPAEWYIPAVVGAVAENKKQGQASGLPEDVGLEFQASLDDECARSYGRYLHFLSRGVAPEHARMMLHLNHYTHWVWKQDLHNLMHFLSLRDHSHAQVEAQAYAKAIDKVVRGALPNLMALYDDYRRMP